MRSSGGWLHPEEHQTRGFPVQDPCPRHPADGARARPQPWRFWLLDQGAGKSKSNNTDLRVFFSVLLVSSVMWSVALDSSSILKSYSIIPLAYQITTILYLPAGGTDSFQQQAATAPSGPAVPAPQGACISCPGCGPERVAIQAADDC